ncbi:MAG: hydroxyacylglutathione hydrolase [Alphaproteobacteria bacterium]|nr:hydroxyacylglutathione hydrolase [Alphaproteobacteria bacterium]
MTHAVHIIPTLDDNYAYIFISGTQCVVIDPGEALPVIKQLEFLKLTPTHIFNTHHHDDHIGGNAELTSRYGARIFAPASEKNRIPNIDVGVRQGDHITLGESVFQVIETPGHTRGHICFYSRTRHVLFCGDTLFSMGCGRILEGTPDEMWQSLCKLGQLPNETDVYCGHEYTLSNGEFSLTVEPDNLALRERVETARDLRALGLPTLPTTIGQEKKTNVFLRAKDATEFAKLRAEKDTL